MGDDLVKHRHTCPLHGQDGIKVCSGHLRRGRGGSCTNKATIPTVPNMLPTCKIHRDQLQLSGQCEEKLACGFMCGRLFAWRPYGFSLCHDHDQAPKCCFFLKIPVEMRMRIYGFLLPDKAIPVRYSTSRQLRSDGELVYTSILAVNHQIHEEAAAVLYSTNAFNIEIGGGNILMCNTPVKFLSRILCGSGGTHALQDYQLQLMLLEQQNKMRLMNARQGSNTSGESSSANSLSHQSAISIPAGTVAEMSKRPIESIWQPTLIEKCFNTIRSFSITVLFNSTKATQQMAIQQAMRSDSVREKFVESKLYDYCDNLHRLVARLQLIPKRISQVQIMIKFGDLYQSPDEAFRATQLLIQPLRRLQKVEKLEILSITYAKWHNSEENLLTPDMYPNGAGSAFSNHLKVWLQDLPHFKISVDGHQVFEAYWQLERLVNSISKETYGANPIFSQFTDLLHGARVAREAEDLVSFKVIWDEVNRVWFQYLENQESFHLNVANSISLITDIVTNRN